MFGPFRRKTLKKGIIYVTNCGCLGSGSTSTPTAGVLTPNGSTGLTRAAAKVAIALVRMEQGNLSNVKGVGAGVSEYGMDFGPGYRIYFGMDGDTLVILLGGGTKKRQGKDIEAAQSLWREYKQRK